MIDWLKRSNTESSLRPGLEPDIDLCGTIVPIALRRHRTAKRLTLRLAPDGSEVRITMPNWAHAREAITFAHSRSEWLEEQFAKVPQRKAPGPGSEVLYRGEAMQIAWDENAPRRTIMRGGKLHVGGPKTGLENRLKRWMEREALTLFEADMADYTAAAALAPVPVALSRAQKRWGSCSEKARIRINWRLVQAPDFVRRSVVAHEVAHLVHFDHSPDFYGLLEDIYDADMATADRWLKDQGRSLYASFG